MKKTGIIILGMIILGFSACITSFHPLYTEETLVINKDLIGKWTDEDNETEWIFAIDTSSQLIDGVEDRTPNTHYTLTLKEKDREVQFITHLLQLKDGQFYLDFFPKRGDFEFKTTFGEDFFDFHLFSVHSFARVTIDKGEMNVALFDGERLNELIKQKKIRIKHEVNSLTDEILLTASSKELQKFIEKYSNDPEIFDLDDQIILTQ